MSTIYYVDPSLSGSSTVDPVTGSGTFADPYNKLPLNYGIVTGAKTYLLKAGTTFVSSRAYNASGTGTEDTNRMMIGSYGAGPKPKWIYSNASGELLALATNNKYWTIRDIDFYCEGENIISTQSATALNYDVSNYFINCNFEMSPGVSVGNGNGLNLFGAGIKILGCTFNNIKNDAIWVGGHNCEVAYNIIKNPGNDGAAQGDSVQFGGDCTNAWVHHNFLDHRNTEGKHCIVINEGTGAVFEDNICLHVTTPSVLSHGIFSSVSCTVRRNYVQGGQNGIWMESLDSVVGLIESNIVVNEHTSGIVCPSARSYTIQNNTVVSHTGATGNGIHYHNPGAATMATIRRNIIQGFARSIYVQTTDTARYSCENNMLYGNGYSDVPNTVSIGTNILSLNPRLDSNYVPQEMIALKMGLTGATKDYNNIDFVKAIGALQPDKGTYYPTKLPIYTCINQNLYYF